MGTVVTVAASLLRLRLLFVNVGGSGRLPGLTHKGEGGSPADGIGMSEIEGFGKSSIGERLHVSSR